MTFNFFIATVKLVIKAETDKNLNKDMSALKSFSITQKFNLYAFNLMEVFVNWKQFC